MGAAAHQVDAVEILEAVVRPEVQHLPHAVGQVEGGAAIDLHVALPVGRRHRLLVADPAFQVGEADQGQAVEHQAAITGGLPRPVDGLALVGDRDQDVERRVPVRRQAVVGDRGVLDIERGVPRQLAALFDLRDVARVVFGQKDRMMVEVIVAPLDPQVEHEGAAGVALPGDLAVAPAPAQMVRHQLGHGLGEVGVYHHGIGAVFADGGAGADRAPTLEDDLLDRRAGLDLHAHLGRHPRHGAHHRTAAALRMKHAVLVFHEGQDGEEARAAERRHAQVFALERKRQADARVLEVARQVAVHRLGRPQQRQRADRVELQEVEGTVESLLQHRPEGLQLAPVVLHVVGQPGGVVRRQPGDFLGHAVQVAARPDLAAAAEDQAVVRVEPDHLDLVLEPAAADREDLPQDPRIEEEGRTHVEMESVGGNGPRAAPDRIQSFEYGDVAARLGQQHRGGQAARAGADDDNGRSVLAHRSCC